MLRKWYTRKNAKRKALSRWKLFYAAVLCITIGSDDTAFKMKVINMVL